MSDGFREYFALLCLDHQVADIAIDGLKVPSTENGDVKSDGWCPNWSSCHQSRIRVLGRENLRRGSSNICYNVIGSRMY
jgi:hypothetical protein